MLCYRCGSHVPDGSDTCGTCGQKFDLKVIHAHTPGVSLAPKKPTALPQEAEAFKEGYLLGDRFLIKSFIGSGPLGQVYRAYDREMDLMVAVKLISPRLLQTPEERKSFSREIRLARQLNHPNLVRTFDEGTQDNWPFFTMQLVEGPTLRQIIDLKHERGEHFTLKELEPIFTQLVSALTSAHGISPHCGVKPENIVVLPDELKLTGFGLGMALPRLPFVAAQRNCGTHTYLAPEFASTEESVDGRVDVYALGVIMGEMLADVLPENGKVPDPRTKAPRLPAEVTSLYKRSLNENPLSRPASPEDFLKDLAKIIEEFGNDVSAADEAEEGEDSAKATILEMAAVGEDGYTPAEGPTAKAIESGLHSIRGMPPAIPGAAKSGKSREKSKRTVLPGASARKSNPKHPKIPMNSAGVPTDVPRSVSASVRVRPSKKNQSTSVIPKMVAGALLVAGILSGGYYLFFTTPEDFAPRPKPQVPTAPGASTQSLAVVVAQNAAVPPSGVQANTPSDASMSAQAEPTQPANGAQPAATAEAAKATGSASSVAVSDKAKPSNDGEKPSSATKEAPTVVAKKEKADAGVAEEKTSPAPAKKASQEKRTQSDMDDDDTIKLGSSKGTSSKGGGKGCPKGMKFISGGHFEAGTSDNDPNRGFGERSLQKIYVNAYCIDVYEFPNIRGQMPKGRISYQLAEAACEKEGKRLCTENEWERACKGTKGLIFPYANTFQAGKCNTQDAYGTSQSLKPSGSSRYCSSDFDVFDLSGNVAEWTSTLYTPKGTGKVIKGGAANRPDHASRCSARRNGPTNKAGSDEMVGFRCCADPGSKK